MAYVIGDDCIACGTCIGECPVEAISAQSAAHAQAYVLRRLSASASKDLLQKYQGGKSQHQVLAFCRLFVFVYLSHIVTLAEWMNHTRFSSEK